MIYRTLGNTGIQAGVIGIGTEHLDGQTYEVIEQVIGAADAAGINMMDLFMPGEEVRRHIGRALKGRRQRFHIQGAIGSVDLREQYDISRDLDTCKRYFEALLRALDTDYIDFGMFFFMDTEEALQQVLQNGIADYAHRLKQEGVIRHVGATSHNPLIARKMVEMGLLETLMFSINPAFDMNPAAATLDNMLVEMGDHRLEGVDPDRAALYLLCEQRGIGITSMKTLGAGKLLSSEHTPFDQPLTSAQCIHYALSRPAVASVMLGYSTAEQVADACRYLTLSEEERDYAAVVRGQGGLMKGACVYCNHCQPCPVEIDIASVHRYLDIARLNPQEVPPSVRQHYNSLAARGADCISCGHCEQRCPFGVPVIENMADAAEIFGA
ncbi:MAG: aldo/keto reductase [Clostridiales bacterium]|nr:aldo/keto reductase [Clostridiales bacterium]